MEVLTFLKLPLSVEIGLADLPTSGGAMAPPHTAPPRDNTLA